MIGRQSCSIVLALALGACSSGNERLASITELVSPPPPNYREIVTARARTVFTDPLGIRETAISAPFAGRSLLGASSTICLRTNARNEKTGAYSDRKVTSFTFRNSELVEVDSRFAPIVCANAVYEPFPDLEQDYTPPPPPAPPRHPKRSKTPSPQR